MIKKPLIVLAGPTAVGKTALSIRLAQTEDCEIISADSMQVYKYMDIGSAKVAREEMQGIPHYLVDTLDPAEEFHVVRFQSMAKAAMETIYGRHRIPLVTGGTGFYIQALTRDIDFAQETADDSYRRELEELAVSQGSGALSEMLRRVDPQSAVEIHPNNRKRLIRALEFYHVNGYPISVHNQREAQRQSPYQLAFFVLTDDRENLYRRIDERVDGMMQAGLADEVRRLRDMGYSRSLVSMQGLGYRELMAWMDGEYSLEEAVRLIKRNTRHFAKRQLTWFRREQDAIWINQKDYAYDQERILGYIREMLKDRGIRLR